MPLSSLAESLWGFLPLPMFVHGGPPLGPYRIWPGRLLRFGLSSIYPLVTLLVDVFSRI